MRGLRRNARVAALAVTFAVGVPILAGLATLTTAAASSPRATGTATVAIPVDGYTPRTIRRVYGVSPLLHRGIDGRGETVVFPESLGEGGNTSIRRDLAAFDRRYRLPRVDLRLGSALGFTGDRTQASAEEVQDLEMVHTIAPAARLTVMLVPLREDADPTSLARLLRTAAHRGNVVSFSQAECETSDCLSAAQLRSLDKALAYARDHHVSVLASSGDSGADTGNMTRNGTHGVRLPASNPLVTGVGGTTLTVKANGAYGGETVWTDDIDHPSSTGARLSASGGGFSVRYVRPAYQRNLPGGDHRGVPDVSATAEPGMASVLVRNGRPRTFSGDGTSEAAPLWAGIAALADQDAHRQLGFLNPALYRIGHGKRYHSAFHDITKGDNTVTLVSGQNLVGYRARPGWDPVTGWGSPNAQVLVPLLVEDTRPH